MTHDGLHAKIGKFCGILKKVLRNNKLYRSCGKSWQVTVDNNHKYALQQIYRS